MFITWKLAKATDQVYGSLDYPDLGSNGEKANNAA